MKDKIFPRTFDKQIVYLKNVINTPDIEVGDYTMYNDFVHDPIDFEKNNVLYHYPVNKDKLKLENSVLLHVGQNFYLPVQITQWNRYLRIRFLFSLKNGDWMQRIYAMHGIIGVIL